MIEFDDSKKSRARAVFRVMLSGIFLVASTNHLLRPSHVAGRLEDASLSWLATWMGPPEALVLMAGGALLAGGVGLAVGFRTKIAALVLMMVVIPITLTVQVGQLSTLGPLFKNIGLLGGLVYFATHGARSFSLDAWLGERHGSGSPTATAAE